MICVCLQICLVSSVWRFYSSRWFFFQTRIAKCFSFFFFFFYDISTQVDDYQMIVSNLVVCFVFSLFNMSGTKSVIQSFSLRRSRKNLGVSDVREFQEQKVVYECLIILVQECKKFFNVSIRILYKLLIFKKNC